MGMTLRGLTLHERQPPSLERMKLDKHLRPKQFACRSGSSGVTIQCALCNGF